MSALRIDDLCVDYGGVHALRHIHLHVEQGEAIALLGANGAGKSSLLRAISGLVAHSGTIALDGEPLVRRSAASIARLGIGHVPEGRRLFARMTVRENLALGCWDTAATDARMQTVFEIFERLRDRADQVAGSLSGGEQQMVALGRALMGSPRLLLLDEPSLGLAPQMIALIFARLGEIHARGTTMILVEQNARAALAFASRAYVLENGAIVRSGNADVLANDPSIIDAYLGGVIE
ncbi:MAG: ABC transporter ATP-binding protein [Vulcanimicrobiaceae bacterium]